MNAFIHASAWLLLGVVSVATAAGAGGAGPPPGVLPLNAPDDGAVLLAVREWPYGVSRS